MTLPRDLPKISIIIPVKNAKKTIDVLINCLVNLDYPTDKTEIIIADGDSTDTTIEQIKNWQKNNPHIRLIQIQNCKSPGAARNAGIAEATGKYILFTDSDCSPQKDWAKQIIAPFFMDPKIGGVGGDILTQRTDHNAIETYCEQMHVLSPTGRCGRTSSGYMPTVHKNLPHEVNGGTNCSFFSTANVAYSKDAIDRVGGTFWPEQTGEEVDFSLRIMKEGYKLYYEIDAVVKHIHRSTLDDYLKQWYRYGYGHPLLIKNHSSRVLEVVFQLGLGIGFSIPSPIKGVVYIGSFQLMHLFSVLTATSAIASLFTSAWNYTITLLLLTLFFIAKYFWPCLKLKPFKRFSEWCKIRYMSNYSLIKGGWDGSRKFGGVSIEPSW